MSFILDFLLLATTGCACFYCWTLNKRLKALQSNEDGFQTGIAALSHSAEEMQIVMKNMNETSRANAEALEQLLSESEKKASDLRTLLENVANCEISQGDSDEVEFVIGDESETGEAA